MSCLRRIAALLGAGLLVLGLGCGVRPTADTTPANAAGADGFPQTVTDSSSHSQTLPRRPARIVSTAPSNTEILFAVGAGEQVVGVTTYCNFPAEAAQRDKVGGFAPKSVSVERIVALKPDLVLTTGRLQQPLTESLRKLGLPVLSYDAQTLEDVARNVRLIGQATGCKKAADVLAAKLEQRLASARARFADLPASARPRVLLLLSEDPLMTAGPKTFAGQMLEVAGGRNLFADVTEQFPRISEEEIIKRNPAAILLWERGDCAPRKERLGKRPGWSRFDAFRNDRILAIDDDLLARAGPRLFDGLEKMAELLHPPARTGEK
jgi:iron complex transport system substrate-binding protein